MTNFKQFIILLFLANPSFADADFQTMESVVKVIAQESGRKQNLGSGVVIGKDLIATNCHVTRKAKAIRVVKNDQIHNVIAQTGLPELDLCVIQTETLLPYAASPLGDGQTGQEVVLFGFPFALGERMRQARLSALHPYRDSSILEVDKGFMQGASGGGVFDDQGRLLGLMTFIGRDQSGLHFYAIPSAWIKQAMQLPLRPLTPFHTKSFWERAAFKP